MKLVRPLLFTLGAILLLVVAAFALALTPAVQRWAVQRALASQPDVKLEFAHLAAGTSGAELREVTFERQGLRVRVASLETDYALWRFVFQRRLEIPRLVAKGVEIDASQLTVAETRAGAAGAPAAAPGALGQVQLPWELVLGTLDVRGRALLPGVAGQPATPVDFEITGGGIAPGEEGAVKFRASLQDTSAGARVTALHTSGELRVHETAQRSFDHVGLTLVIDAEGPRIAQPNQLKLAATLASSAGAATYALTVDTLQAGESENLLKLDATAPTGESRFTGRWAVQAQQSQLEPFFLGGALPKFTVTGAGTFALHPGTGATALEGKLDGTTAALETLDPALRALGTIRWGAQFDVAAEKSVVAINRFAARIDGDRPVAAFESNRALTLDLERRQVQLAAGTGEVGRLKLQGLPLAWIRPFVSAVDLSGGAVTGEFVVAGDTRELRISSVAPLQVAGVNIVKNGALLLDRADVGLSLEAALAPERAAVQVRDFALTTPAGDHLRGELDLASPLAGESRAVTVRVRGDADLPRLLEPFLPLGHLRGSGEADLSYSPARLDVRAFRSELANGARQKLFSAVGTKPFALDLHRLQLVPTSTDEVELARVNFERIAFDQFPAWQARFPLQGELAPGGFVVAAQGQRLFFRPTAPVRLANLTLESNGHRVLDGLGVQTTPTVEFASLTDWKIADGATVLRDRNGVELLDVNVEATAGAEGMRASASFNADLAALGGQPVLASLQALSAGRASGEMRAALNGRAVQIEARSTMNGLVAREGNQALPVANLSLRAVRSAAGEIKVEAPLLLDRLGQRSDLKLTVSAVPQGGVTVIDAQVAGEHLELADALALLAFAGGQGSAPSATAPSAPAIGAPRSPSQVADAKPFWSGVRGDVTVDVKEIVRGPEWTMKNFAAALRLDPAAVRLEKLTGAINEKGALGGRAELAFRAGAQPYALTGEFTLSEFDVGALLKAFDPDKPPTLEGIFAVAGKFSGTGRTLDDTLERTRGSFELKSQSGVFRGLRRTSEKVSVASKAVEIGAALGSLFGSSKVKEAAEKVAGQTYQVDQLAQALAELPFDQFVIRANRDERLNFQVEELSLLSPEVRFNARGTVNYVEGKSVLEQPLNLGFQLAARGKVEQTLNRLRALDGTKDELGYSKAKNLGAITGTVSRPTPNELFQRLLESKVGDFLN
ncbi:MAG: hypothetical protein C0518_12745 [Opitutus sp.]|nr:hypothetical protein [Opitutus sp.]